MLFFHYLLKVSFGLVLFYALYWGLLRKHTYFTANRIYLLLAIGLSCLAPWVVLPEAAHEQVPMRVMALGAVTGGVVQVEKPPLFTLEEGLAMAYLVGVFFMLGRLIWRLSQVFKLVRAGEHQPFEDCVLVTVDDSSMSSFSFFNYLVLNQKDASVYGQVVVSHELVHIQQRHSWDLLWVEVVQALLWFNPILIFYKRSLKEIHEFIADENATNGDRLSYAYTLAGYALGVSPQTLTNNFFDVKQLKSRIAMLTKKRSSKWVLGRYLMVVPVVVALVVLVAARSATPVQTSVSTGEDMVVKGKVVTADGKGLAGVNVVVVNLQRGTITDAKGNYAINVARGRQLAFSFIGFKMQVIDALQGEQNVVMIPEVAELKGITVVGEPIPAKNGGGRSVESGRTAPTMSKEGTIFTVAEQHPEFPGGTRGLSEFLANNLKYPAAARRAHVSGKVFLEFTIDENGVVKEPRVVKGIGFGCDEEAMRIMGIMPNWTPAKQNGNPVAMSYQLPIGFELEKAAANPTFTEGPVKIIFNGKGSPFKEQPLYILDGKEITYDELEKKINPSEIDNISVLKNESATATYGDKGKNGVVIITTKKKN